MEKSICRTLLAAVTMLAASTSVLGGELSWKKSRFPADIEVNIGGVGAMGKTSEAFSSAFAIGGNLSWPVCRFLQLDGPGLDFGLGTLGPSRSITVEDGSRRKVKNYQIMVSAGPRFVVPIPHSRVEFSVGGGVAAIAYNEYPVGRSYYQGNVLVRESITCYSCTRESSVGEYGLAQLMFRDRNSGFGIGFTGRYYRVKSDRNPNGLPYGAPAEQRFLTVGFTIIFRI